MVLASNSWTQVRMLQINGLTFDGQDRDRFWRLTLLCARNLALETKAEDVRLETSDATLLPFGASIGSGIRA